MTAGRRYRVNDYYQYRNGRRVLVRGHQRTTPMDVGQSSLLTTKSEETSHKKDADQAINDTIKRIEVFSVYGTTFDTFDEARAYADRMKMENALCKISGRPTSEIRWVLDNADEVVHILKSSEMGEDQ